MFERVDGINDAGTAVLMVEQNAKEALRHAIADTCSWMARIDSRMLATRSSKTKRSDSSSSAGESALSHVVLSHMGEKVEWSERTVNAIGSGLYRGLWFPSL